MTFRSASRTVVTEIKSFVVDTVTRSGAFRQSVSARIDETKAFNRKDINVSEVDEYTVEDVSSIAAVHSPEPIVLYFEQDVATEPEPEPEPEHTVEFQTPQTFYANEPLVIRYVDTTLANVGTIDVVVLNLDTGETEYVTLDAEEPSIFIGELPTHANPLKGIDFDSSLNVVQGHNILIRYNEVETFCGVLSHHENPVLTVPKFVFASNPIPVRIESEAAAHTVVNIQVTRNLEVQNIVLTETSAGVFETVLEPSEFDTHILYVASKFATTNMYETDVRVFEPQHVDVEIHADAYVSEGSSAEVVVFDYNRANAGNLVAVMTSSRTSEHLMVTLQESAPYSGKFVANISVTPTMQPGDVLTIAYVDVYDEEPERHEVAILVEAATPPEMQRQALQVAMSLPELQNQKHTVMMEVDGLFLLNGSFNGRIRIRGMRSTPTRCSLMFS